MHASVHRKIHIMFKCPVAVLLSSASSSATGCCQSNPYKVLGVEPNTPFDEVKSRFHELAQLYHPDMPNGDAGKFREINAAYRQLRATHREWRSNNMNTQTHHQSEFWGSQGNTADADKEDHYTKQWKNGPHHSTTNARMRGTQQRAFMHEILWLYEGYEMALILGTAVVVLIIAFERYLLVRRVTQEKRSRRIAMEEGLPPSMPLEVDENMMRMYNVPVPSEAIEMDEAIAKEMTYHRRATQRRFEDFREFLFVYDPDGVTSRKVTTVRVAAPYVDEPLIPTRCPVVREFNSEQKGTKYENILKEVVETSSTTPWLSPDAQFAAPLVVQGLAVIPMNSPNTAKWTFIEYKNADNPTDPPMCLVALRNRRFEKLGMCQRVTISGSGQLSAKLLQKREEDLKNGLRGDALVKGSPLPLKDTTTALEHMKL